MRSVCLEGFVMLIIQVNVYLCWYYKRYFMSRRHQQHQQQQHQYHSQQMSASASGSSAKSSRDFPPLENFSTESPTGNQTVISDLHGTLLRSPNPFPYFFLVAFEAGGGFPRALILLGMYPLIALLHRFGFRSLALKITIFIALAGVRESSASSAARAVLPKFFLEDMRSDSYKVFVSCGKRLVVTSTPRIMVEPFLKEFLAVEEVVGTELEALGGFYTGFVKTMGTLKERLRDRTLDIGLGSKLSDCSFLSLCKESFLVSTNKPVPAVSRGQYLKPLVFHDGRFAIRPSPLIALLIFLWLPFGIILAIARVLVAVFCPSVQVAGILEALLGIRIRMKGKPPASARINGHGVLFVCTHRMLVDPLFLCVCLRRKITAVTYSISRVSEILSPIKTMPLTRCRERDAQAIKSLLSQGDLAVCPEGTTCREPYLLRFSALFAELTDQIVPVAVSTSFQFFHGSTARGWKALDPLFFLLNPFPAYEIEFLEQVPAELTCSAGKTSFEVANYVQRKLADALGFECTNFTRKDKYRMLAGNDGTVEEKRPSCPRPRSSSSSWFSTSKPCSGWRIGGSAVQVARTIFSV